jgi:hypothetical protein
MKRGIVNLLKEWKSLQKKKDGERKEAEEEEWTIQGCVARMKG